MYVLLLKLRNVQAGGDPDRHIVPDEALQAFMQHCSERVGDAYFRTPRNTIRQFVHLMAVLEQNPGATWSDLLAGVEITEEADPALDPLPEDADLADDDTPVSASDPDDELTSFTL